MASTSIDDVIASPRGERRVYTWAALAAIAVVFTGFAPTYYLTGVFNGPELTTLKHVHAVVMTAWFTLFLVQARLVATGHVATHRKLGLAGVALAALVVVMGLQLAIASARAGVTPLPSIPPLVFFVMPVGEMVVFTTLFTAAILMRRRPPIHKRLMLVASISMLTPAMARLPALGAGGPLVFFALTDLVLLACIAFDAIRNRRVHPAFIAAFGVVVVGQFGRLALTRTDAWMSFARWITA